MWMYLYIHNKYTQNTRILCKQKLLFCMQLFMINCLTALIYIQFYLRISKYLEGTFCQYCDVI